MDDYKVNCDGHTVVSSSSCLPENNLKIYIKKEDTFNQKMELIKSKLEG